GADHHRVRVRTLVALDADRAHGREDREALPELPVEAGPAYLVEQDRVGGTQDREPLLGDVADDPDREARARERVAPDHPLRQAELLADAPDLVLEERTEGLHELHPHVGREAADVVVRLDLRRDPHLTAGLDHVGVEGSLDQEPDVAELPRLFLEDADELLADDRALLLGLRDSREAREEPLA